MYQFKALPFGPSRALREFCHVTLVLGTLLHKLTIQSSVLGRLAPQSHVKSHLSGTHPDSTREDPSPGLPSELGQVGARSGSEVCLPRRGLRPSGWASQTLRGSSRKGSDPLQNTVQTTPPEGSLSPLAVRGSQLSSRHHSLWSATHETSSALPHRSVFHGVTTVVFHSETQRSILSPPRVVGEQTQSDMRGSPHFPQNVFNIVYRQLNHGLGSNPRPRRLCFRDMDSSRS